MSTIKKPRTPNQKAYEKELARIERFIKQFPALRVKLPQQPKRITKKDIDTLKKLRGKNILAQGTILRPADDFFETDVPQSQNALEYFNQIAGENANLSGNKLKEFQSLLRAALHMATNKGLSLTDTIIKEFDNSMGTYRPAFQDVMSKWKDKMIKTVGKEKFVDLLLEQQKEIGGFTKSEVYNLQKMTKWLNRFAERIEDRELREQALQEVEFWSQQDTTIEAFETEKYRKSRRGRRK